MNNTQSTTATKSTMSNHQNTTISYKDLSVDKLDISKLEDTTYNTAQKTAFVNYKHDAYKKAALQFQSPYIKLFTYGIPTITEKNKKWYPSDKNRAFVKIPEDVNNPKCVEFFKKLDEVDTYFQSNDFKKLIFGNEKIASTYTYQPIVRSPDSTEHDDANDESVDVPEIATENKSEKQDGPRYIKVKIDLQWETNNILTKCYVLDDSKQRTIVNDIATIDDLKKYIKFNSSICMVLIANKMYAAKAKVNGAKKYGITFKIAQCVCDNSQLTQQIDDTYDKFLNTDTTGIAFQNVKTSDNTITYVDINTSNLEIMPVEETKFNTAQKTSFIKYKKATSSKSFFQFQTPMLNIFTYGMPRITEKNKKWYPTEKSRAHIKIPFDSNNTHSSNFFKKLEEMDMFFQSNEFKKHIFGNEKIASTYTYQPIVRIPEELDDSENPVDTTQNIDRPKYIKVNIDLHWETNEILTKCFLLNENNERVEIKQDQIKTLDDLLKFIRFKSNITVVIVCNKVYAAKTKVNGTKKYGVTFKAIQILCEPVSNHPSNNQSQFIDDDSEMVISTNNAMPVILDENDDSDLYETNNETIPSNIKSDLDTDETEQTVQPIVQPIVQPPVQPIAQPTVQPTVQPIAQPPVQVPTKAVQTRKGRTPSTNV